MSLGLISALLLHCDDSLSARFGLRAVPAAPPDNTSCDDIVGPLMSRAPISELSALHVSPPGTPEPWSGLPSAGLLFKFDTESPGPRQLMAPADGWVVLNGAAENTALNFRLCPEVSVRFAGVLPNQGLRVPEGAPPAFVTAGTVLGVLQDSHFFGMAVQDTRVQTAASSSPRATFLDRAVCPLKRCAAADTGCQQYLSDSEIDRWIGLMRDHTGTAMDADHACGVYPLESRATAEGVWFPEDLPSATPSVHPLIISRDPSGAPFGIISNGPRQADPNPWVLTNVFQGIFWFRIANPPDGPHNDDFAHVATAMDGGTPEVHCYDNLTDEKGAQVGSLVLLALDGDGGLIAEASTEPTCALFWADGHYTMPMVAATRLVR